MRVGGDVSLRVRIAMFVRLARLGCLLALPAFAGCSAEIALPAASHDGAWEPPPAAPCVVPADEVVEHWRALPSADLVGVKSVDRVGRLHTRFFNAACEALEEKAVVERIGAAAIAEREAQIDAVGEERVSVQVWLGSRREYAQSPAHESVHAERDARKAALPANLRGLLEPLEGTFAYVGEVSRTEAHALARHEAVRLMFAYAPLADAAPAQVRTALALPERSQGTGEALAVFDECSMDSSPASMLSFASAAGAECLSSSHGTRVARLAYEGLPSGAARVTAGLTTTTTDAPESLAAPALWAIVRQHASVVVQTIHTEAGPGANDALDTLLREAAYPEALLVRAVGNGVASDEVVHRTVGALDVGANGPEGAPLPSSRFGNPRSRFGDVERPAILDDGVVVDEEGGAEGTSFAAPRTARAAFAIAPSRTHGYTPLVRRAQILAAARAFMAAPGDLVRTHQDGNSGAGVRGEVAVDVSSETSGMEEAIGVNLASGDRVVRELRVPFADGSPVSGTFALVFEGAPAPGAFDPTRSAADLDLRVVTASGTTVATSRSFDDDQEVVTTALRGGETVRVSVEQASATPARRAVIVWRFRRTPG